ncbi:hypothetical protein V6N13_045794 [Hibiscus sabdariffa]
MQLCFTRCLKLIDTYDLYGPVAYPKHHKQYEVPDIYGLAAKTKGVFINPAFIEPFGLTVIEAAAYDLPIVATKNGVLLTFIRDKPSTKQSIFVHNKATLYNMSFHLVPKTEATLKNMPFHLTVPTSFKLKV